MEPNFFIFYFYKNGKKLRRKKKKKKWSIQASSVFLEAKSSCFVRAPCWWRTSSTKEATDKGMTCSVAITKLPKKTRNIIWPLKPPNFQISVSIHLYKFWQNQLQKHCKKPDCNEKTSTNSELIFLFFLLVNLKKNS